MSSESRARIDERESWLASMPEEPEASGGGGATRPQLLATAALVHGAVKGIEVPEDEKQRSRQRVRAVWSAQGGDRPDESARGSGWPQTISGLLGVVFRLGRKK
jgi:hypothetical protein